MLEERPQHRVLIVSDADKIADYITELLPPREFSPILRAGSAGDAKRMLLSAEYDIVIINSPLPDEFGTSLATDISEDSTKTAVMLLVKSDSYDAVAYKVEKSGVLTLPKPNSKQAIYSAVRLLAAMSVKLGQLEKKNRTLQEKMADIRTVNRAKWLLIENLGMTEKDAHYYIEKQAMDTRMPRREVAVGIIRTYDK